MRNLSNYNPGRPELLCLRSRRTKPKITMDKEKITTAKDHNGQAEFAKSRPSSQSPGQVRKVQAKFAKSRPEITTARPDHDGQARTTGETTMARRGQRAARQG